MNTEPTLLSTILSVIIYLVVTVGFVYIICVVDKFFKDNSGGPTWYEEYTRKR